MSHSNIFDPITIDNEVADYRIAKNQNITCHHSILFSLFYDINRQFIVIQNISLICLNYYQNITFKKTVQAIWEN